MHEGYKMIDELDRILSELLKENFIKHYRRMPMENFEDGFVLEFDDSIPMFIGKKFGVKRHLNVGMIIALNPLERQMWTKLEVETKNQKVAQCIHLLTRTDARMNIVPSVEEVSAIDIESKIEGLTMEKRALAEKIWYLKLCVNQISEILRSFK